MSNKPKRQKPTIIQLIPIIHKLFGRDNHYLSHYGCKKRAVEEFYKMIDGGDATTHTYPSRCNEPAGLGNRQLLPTTQIITNNKV